MALVGISLFLGTEHGENSPSKNAYPEVYE